MSEEAVVDVPVAPVVPATVETPEATPPVDTPVEEKTFTQKDIDAIIANRYGREKVKQDKIERELRAERDQRIRLEERVAALDARKPQQQQQALDNDEPKIEDYDNFVTFNKDLAKWQYKQEREAEKLAEKQEREATERKKTVDSWSKRLETSTAEMPDLHDVLATSGVPVTSIMQQAIMESENGPKLAYHLATNPADAERIAGMTPIGAVRALTLIEEGLKKPVAVSKATPPITPVGSKATSIKSLLDVKDYDEFSKRRAAQIAKRR